MRAYPRPWGVFRVHGSIGYATARAAYALVGVIDCTMTVSMLLTPLIPTKKGYLCVASALARSAFFPPPNICTALY